MLIALILSVHYTLFYLRLLVLVMADSEKKLLLSAISSLSENIASAVKQAWDDFKTASDVYEFINTKNVIRKLFTTLSASTAWE